ncbi:MAG: arylesterase [Acidiferrobacterales bacterium]|nr:arylesterase [Acidiferrobacterales bacterium]
MCIKRISSTLVILTILIGFAGTVQAKKILVFGDSLSAAYGMDVEQGWVHLLEQYLNNEYSHKWDDKPFFQVYNASISGETTTGGMARIELSLKEFSPDIVLLELGANDGLQGYPTTRIANNLNTMIDMIEVHGAQAVLLGISIPPSYGPRYVDEFRKVFPSVAEQRGLPFVDLYREDYYLEPGYIQRDGLHPTAVTQPIIRDLVVEYLSQENLL